MADTYTQESVGRAYNPWRMAEGENLVDYYARLRSGREGGILGTSGLMDKAMSVEEEDLGEVKKNKPVCPPGYVYDEASGSCVQVNGDSVVPSTRERFESSQRGQVIGNALGKEEAWAREDAQGALDRLTGRAPTLNDVLMAMVPGGGILSALSNGNEDALREYIGSGGDLEKVKGMLDGNMSASELERTLGSREALGRSLATSGKNTQDWESGAGMLDTIGSRITGGVGSIVSSLFGDFGRTLGANAPYSSKGFTDNQMNTIGAMTGGQRAAMWGGPGGSLMTGGTTNLIPSFAATSGNNWEPSIGLFTQDYNTGLRGDMPTVGGGFDSDSESNWQDTADYADRSSYGDSYGSSTSGGGWSSGAASDASTSDLSGYAG